MMEVHDRLHDLEAGCPPELRPSVALVRSYLRVRESRHALQELLEAVRDRLTEVSAQGEGVRSELHEWRPTVLLALEAERKRIDAATMDAETRAGLVGWLRSPTGIQTLVLIAVLVLSAFGIRVSLPAGLAVTVPTVEHSAGP